MKKFKQFKPNGDLMSQLSKLTKKTAKVWWEEYLKFHKGIDQGAGYCAGYFPEKHRTMLQKIFITK